VTYLDNLLSTVFSVDVGESESQQRAFMESVRTADDGRQRDGLRQELSGALADPEHDWADALARNEVYPAPGESARDFVVERIWVPLFGRETLPAAQ
jgi:hypothetical protein